MGEEGGGGDEIWKLNETLQVNSMILCAHLKKKFVMTTPIVPVHFLKELHQKMIIF